MLKTEIVGAKKKRKNLMKTSHGALQIVCLKMTVSQRRKLKQIAKRYADGNLSAWLRHAGFKYIPRAHERII